MNVEIGLGTAMAVPDEIEFATVRLGCELIVQNQFKNCDDAGDDFNMITFEVYHECAVKEFTGEFTWFTDREVGVMIEDWIEGAPVFAKMPWSAVKRIS